MGFILTPDVGGVETEFSINAWHWRCILQILRRADVLDEEAFELCGIQVGYHVDIGQASHIADYLDDFLTELGPGQRVLLDGSVATNDESRPPLRVGPGLPEPNVDDVRWAYSTTYERLAEFRDFCRISEGFEVG